MGDFQDRADMEEDFQDRADMEEDFQDRVDMEEDFQDRVRDTEEDSQEEDSQEEDFQDRAERDILEVGKRRQRKQRKLHKKLELIEGECKRIQLSTTATLDRIDTYLI